MPPGTSTPTDFTSVSCNTLQYQSPSVGQWVLKCPDHIFALAELRAVYPDAAIAFVHRDPLAVLASVARLTEVLRRPFSRRVVKLEIGRQDSDRWLAATELMIAAADDSHFAQPIFHIHYLHLVADPLGTVAALYRHFGRSLSPIAAERIGRLVAAKPNGGYGAHRSRLEEYGLDPRPRTRALRAIHAPFRDPSRTGGKGVPAGQDLGPAGARAIVQNQGYAGHRARIALFRPAIWARQPVLTVP